MKDSQRDGTWHPIDRRCPLSAVWLVNPVAWGLIARTGFNALSDQVTGGNFCCFPKGHWQSFAQTWYLHAIKVVQGTVRESRSSVTQGIRWQSAQLRLDSEEIYAIATSGSEGLMATLRRIFSIIILMHWGPNRMADILQMTFSNAFPFMEMFVYIFNDTQLKHMSAYSVL